MFEQLAHDIKSIILAPFTEPEIKMGLIHEMIDKTIERNTDKPERSTVELPVDWSWNRKDGV